MDLNLITSSLTEIENYEYKVCKSFTQRKGKYILNSTLTHCSCKSYEFCKLSIKTCKHLQYFRKYSDSNKIETIQPNKPKKLKNNNPYYYSFVSFNNTNKTYYLNKDLTKCSCISFLINTKTCKHIDYYTIKDNKDKLVVI